MHRGDILSEGTLAELREKHRQVDLEDLFFDLISQHEAGCRDRLPSVAY
jgi:hypothetical protein